MESFLNDQNNKAQEYDFCKHLKQHYFNNYLLNLNTKTINQDEKNKEKKINLPNFFDLKNQFINKKSLSSTQINGFLNKFFIKNLNLNWIALYNPQNISLNSINRDGCIFTVSFDETGEILASSNHVHNIEIWDTKEKKVKKVIKDHKEIVTGIEFFNTNSNINFYNNNNNFNNLRKKRKFDFTIANKIQDENMELHSQYFDLENKDYTSNSNEENIDSDNIFNSIQINNNNNEENLQNSNSNIYIENNNNVDSEDFSNGFTSENIYMMSCSLDKTIKLWKNFNCIHTFLDHNDWVRCLAISNDNNYFLSGCVSSVIKYWDLSKKKVLYTFNNSNDNPDLLNTVNSLNFMSNDPNVFMTGLRNGVVKIFDVRKPNKLVREFKAHKCKLNSVKFNKDDKYLLSSGRDSVARLWDFRNLPNSDNPDNNLNYTINEYRGHKCQGYNIDCNFFCNENYVITGSEDSNIYIYDTLSANIVAKYKTHQKCVNLVKPYPNHTPFSFAYTGLEDMSIYLWDASKNITKFIDRNYCAKRNDVEEEFDKDNEYNDLIENQEKDSTQQIYVKLIEEIMSECGDMILRIFHSNNLTYSNGMNFENLLEIIQKNNDQESIKIINMLNEKFMKRICESWINDSITGASNKTKSEIKSNTKLKRNNNCKNKVKFECLICSMKKKNNNINRQIQEEYDNYLNYEDDLFSCDDENYIINNKFNNYNNNQLDICKKNNLQFFDNSNYYKYHNDDIRDILRLPNINNSFVNFDFVANTDNNKINDNDNLNKRSKILINENETNNLMSWESVGNENNNFTREININKENVKVKTLYSNEDISIRYNYILKKLI